MTKISEETRKKVAEAIGMALGWNNSETDANAPYVADAAISAMIESWVGVVRDADTHRLGIM